MQANANSFKKRKIAGFMLELNNKCSNQKS